MTGYRKAPQRTRGAGTGGTLAMCPAFTWTTLGLNVSVCLDSAGAFDRICSLIRRVRPWRPSHVGLVPGDGRPRPSSIRRARVDPLYVIERRGSLAFSDNAASVRRLRGVARATLIGSDAVPAQL